MTILVSRQRAAELMGTTEAAVRQAVKRGRLDEDNALCGSTVRKGITLDSLKNYCGWSQRTIDQICESHSVDPDSASNRFLTTMHEGC